MRFEPKQKNKKAFIMAIITLVAGLAAFASSTVDVFKGHGVLQIIGAAFLAFAVYFTVKTITVYSYIILPIEFEGTPDSPPRADAYKPDELAFTVAKRYSKGKESYVCQLDMSTLIAVKDIPDSYKKNDVIMHFKPCDVFDYTVTVGRKNACLLVFNKHGYNKTAVVCELEGEMLSYLKEVKLQNDRRRQSGE